MSKVRAPGGDGRVAPDVRICRINDLVVRDASGHSRAFRFGERVEMTPDLLDALGGFADRFEPSDTTQLDLNAPMEPFITVQADAGVTLPPGTKTALVDPAHEE